VGQAKGNDDNGRENMSIRSEGGDSVSEHRGRIAGANGSMVRKVSAVSINNFAFSS
jgi:voltage-gated sodium channel type II alpha